MKISVFGSGGWGTALALSCAKNGHDVCLWSYLEQESAALEKERENKAFLPGVMLDAPIRYTSDVRVGAEYGEMIISVVPSHAVRSTARAMAPFAGGKIVLNASKGLEEGSLMRMSQVIAQEIPNAKVAVLSGPSHAEEVGRLMPTTSVAACEDEEIARFVQDAMMTAAFRVYTNTDVIGVELGGALKNVIALCAGITDGCGFGDNAKAALMTRGLAEIARLGVKMGARRDTFMGLAGVGDLIVTCTSMHSRNRRAGILIGQGRSLEEALEEVHMTVEGVKTTAAAYDMARRAGVEMPIVNAAHSVLFEGRDASDAVRELMLRDKKKESEADIL